MSIPSKTAQKFPDNNNVSLTSLGNIYDDGCKTEIDKHECEEFKDKVPMLTAPRCRTTGMHVMNLKAPIPKNNHQCLLNAVPSNRKYQTAGMQNFTFLERIFFYMDP